MLSDEVADEHEHLLPRERRRQAVVVHVVAARLGDDAKTVLSTYAHLLPQSDELAAERVAAALAP